MNATPTNFLAQFGEKVSESEAEEKAKRKADEFDSDEDDEEEWERMDAERQAAKRRKLLEDAKGKAFVLDLSGSESDSQQNKPAPFGSFKITPSPLSQPGPQQALKNTLTASGVFGSGASTPSTTGGRSVFEGHVPGSHHLHGSNIFASLSDAESGVESKTGDADDEDEDSYSGDSEHQRNVESVEDEGLFVEQRHSDDQGEEEGEQSDADDDENDDGHEANGDEEGRESASSSRSPSAATPRGGLFDRITKSDGSPFFPSAPTNSVREEESTNKSGFDFSKINKSTSPTSSPPRQPVDKSQNPFSAQTPSFGQTPTKPSASPQPFSSSIFGSTKPLGDNTWKPDSPIKFGSSTSAPSVNVSAPSPTPTVNGTGDGATTPKPTSNPFGSLFGQNSGTSTPTSNFFASAPVKPTVGFSFGGPASSHLLPSGINSAMSSRATSPGLTTDTGGESDIPSEAEKADNEEFVNENAKPKSWDLTTPGKGEEDEEVIFEVKAKANVYSDAGKEKKEWQSRGIGLLRLLENKESGLVRIVMRQDPSGKIVINTGLLKGANYSVKGAKNVALVVPDKSGQLESWNVTVKHESDAKKLAELCEQHKVS